MPKIATEVLRGSGFTHDPLCRVDPTADMLGVKPKTLRNWMSLGRISFVRVGPRAVRIPLSEINRIITEGTRPAREAK